jgi:hypothetical protein
VFLMPGYYPIYSGEKINPNPKFERGNNGGPKQAVARSGGHGLRQRFGDYAVVH